MIAPNPNPAQCEICVGLGEQNFVNIYADAQGLETPTWVHALANGNLELWEAVIDVTKEVMDWDDEPDES